MATIYSDAPTANYKTNQKANQIKKDVENSKSELKQWAAEGGGYAISIFPATKDAVKGLKRLK